MPVHRRQPPRLLPPGLPRRPCAVRKPSDSRPCRSGLAGAGAGTGPRPRGGGGRAPSRPEENFATTGPPPYYDLMVREVSEDGWGGRRQDPLAVRLVPSVECSAFPRRYPSLADVRVATRGLSLAPRLGLSRGTPAARRGPSSYRKAWSEEPNVLHGAPRVPVGAVVLRSRLGYHDHR